MVAYTDAAAVAGYLGLTLTAAQQSQANALASAATAWIDRYTGRSWQASSPISDEQHELIGDTVYLTQRPVTAVSSVKTRERYADAGTTTLDASQWELLDAANGVLLILGWAGAGALALVTYTHSVSAAPDDVELAATMIAASWLSQALRPSTEGLDSISVGQNDVSVKFSANRGDVPPSALSILNGYRRVVIA